MSLLYHAKPKLGHNKLLEVYDELHDIAMAKTVLHGWHPVYQKTLESYLDKKKKDEDTLDVRKRRFEKKTYLQYLKSAEAVQMTMKGATSFEKTSPQREKLANTLSGLLHSQLHLASHNVHVYTLEEWIDHTDISPEKPAYIKEYEILDRKYQRRITDLIEHNLGLVYSMARRYSFSKLPEEDIIQAGVMGLQIAIDRYDPELGFRFSTYATNWLRHSIGRYVDDHCNTIRIPIHMMESQRKVAKELELRKISVFDLTAKDEQKLCSQLKVSRQVFNAMRYVSNSMSSLDSPIREDKDLTFADILGEDNAGYEGVEENERLQKVLEICTLTDKEKEILIRRYVHNETLKKIGDDHELSRERIRQLENKAKSKLKFAGKRLQRVRF